MTIFEVQRNSDLTEGRGGMVPVSWHATLDEAVAAARGVSTQGSDGDVCVCEPLSELEDVRAFRGFVRREKVWGRWWEPVPSRVGGYGWRTGYAPGWDPRGADPEWAEYQRLLAKFERER